MGMPNKQPDYELFLKELTCLSKKHGIVISGCGCCGSPSVVEDETSNSTAHYVVSGLTQYGGHGLTWLQK